MERLTYVTENGEILFKPEDLPADTGMTITQLAEDGRFKVLEIIAGKLAAYEDTGLTPGQIREIDKLYAEKCKELAEYQQAEEQGLLMRLPCKIGDTVYAIEADEEKFKAFYCPAKVAEYEFGLYMLDLMGKCVFPTREEAEAKLAEREDSHDNS